MHSHLTHHLVFGSHKLRTILHSRVTPKFWAQVALNKSGADSLHIDQEIMLQEEEC